MKTYLLLILLLALLCQSTLAQDADDTADDETPEEPDDDDTPAEGDPQKIDRDLDGEGVLALLRDADQNKGIMYVLSIYDSA